MPQVTIKPIYTADGTEVAYSTPGVQAGHVVSFDANIPTMDAGLQFYVSQLEALETKIYETKYKNITFGEDIPLKSDVPEWADEWTYIGYDAVTLGKFIGANADDLPSVALSANKSTVKIGYAGIEYFYSMEELRKSSVSGIPLDATMGRMANRGSQEHSQRVAYFGDADRGMEGLFNNSNVPLDGSTLDWTTATGEQIFADVNGLLTEVWTNSAETAVPNYVRLPSARWALMQSKKMADGTDTTVLEYFKKNNLYTGLTGAEIDVRPRLQLKGAAAGGTNDRMMAYEYNEDNLAMAMPLMFRPLPPQPDGLKLKVPCEYKLSGTEFRYPFAAAYRDFNTTI